MQAMQNVTGRFIRNAVTQLRKRAAGLCIEELKEYKVAFFTKCCWKASPFMSSSEKQSALAESKDTEHP